MWSRWLHRRARTEVKQVVDNLGQAIPSDAGGHRDGSLVHAVRRVVSDKAHADLGGVHVELAVARGFAGD